MFVIALETVERFAKTELAHDVDGRVAVILGNVDGAIARFDNVSAQSGDEQVHERFDATRLFSYRLVGEGVRERPSHARMDVALGCEQGFGAIGRGC